ncbi:MAG: hypothetical protein LQ345_002893 [Seirophora villosa]|nr:MAG: hypothetical protein LQ345_002893 [Seirophora villosa]
MSSSSLPHAQRTAAVKREADLHHLILSNINQVNENIRLLRLQVSPTRLVKARFSITTTSHPDLHPFRSGQWLDVYLPGIRQPGGFTVTSTPNDAQWSDGKPGYLELAIQKSPNNPPAAWLWRPEAEIIASGVIVRVGGSFVWPPPNVNPAAIMRLVFVAGGVGINPLISILSHIHQHPPLFMHQISFLYTTRFPQSKEPSSVLFLHRLCRIFGDWDGHHTLSLFLTQCSEAEKQELAMKMGADSARQETVRGRISHRDLLNALGPVEERVGTVVYICGVPSMTDDFVSLLRGAEGMEENRVLCEKWW